MKEYQKPEIEVICYTGDALLTSGLFNHEINDSKNWNNDNII